MSLFKYITKRTFVFGVAGAIGALVGSVVAEPLKLLLNDGAGLVGLILWVGFIGSGIAILLLYAQNRLSQKKTRLNHILKTGLGGFGIGAIAGIIAQILFSVNPTETIRIIAWGLFGMILGFGMTKVVPNYPKLRAAIAGLIGGIIGGIIFIILATLFYDVVARIIGTSVIGFFIGLMISLFEEMLREAWLIVEWNEKEKTHISLGETPVIIGSSPDAHIYLSGFPLIAATIRLEKGGIKFEDKSKNKISILGNDSKIQFGSINFVIKAK